MILEIDEKTWDQKGVMSDKEMAVSSQSLEPSIMWQEMGGRLSLRSWASSSLTHTSLLSNLENLRAHVYQTEEAGSPCCWRYECGWS